MEQQNFFDFISEEMDGKHFNYFLTLGYIPGRRRNLSKAYGRFEAFDEWVDQIRREVVWVEDHRGDGTARFHVVVPLWRSKDKPWAESYWRSVSGGWAISRGFGDPWNTLPIYGLLGHYVMRLGFPLYIGWPPEFRRYTQRDFIPWGPKSPKRR